MPTLPEIIDFTATHTGATLAIFAAVAAVILTLTYLRNPRGDGKADPKDTRNAPTAEATNRREAHQPRQEPRREDGDPFGGQRVAPGQQKPSQRRRRHDDEPQARRPQRWIDLD